LNVYITFSIRIQYFNSSGIYRVPRIAIPAFWEYL
jgi:hypothetical protein